MPYITPRLYCALALNINDRSNGKIHRIIIPSIYNLRPSGLKPLRLGLTSQGCERPPDHPPENPKKTAPGLSGPRACFRGCASGKNWHPVGDLNPCCRRERATFRWAGVGFLRVTAVTFSRNRLLFAVKSSPNLPQLSLLQFVHLITTVTAVSMR